MRSQKQLLQSSAISACAVAQLHPHCMHISCAMKKRWYE